MPITCYRFFLILFVIIILQFVPNVFGVVQTDDSARSSFGGRSRSVPTTQPFYPLLDPASLLTLPPSLNLTTVPVPPQRPVNPDDPKPKQESYRVFFPTDNDGKVVNNIVWLPEEFFRLLHKSTPDTPQLKSKNWNIESAEYVGKLIFNSLTQTFEITEFKAVYQIGVESDDVTITLPALPLSATTALWDSIPIRAAWQINENNSRNENNSLAEKTDNKLLTFEIENAKHGSHKLEIPLEPQIINGAENFRISFDVPRVPNAKLKLTTPPNSPTITVPESLGEISLTEIKDNNNNTKLKPDTNNNQKNYLLTADIGSVAKLTLTWCNDLYHSELSDIEADMFIRMQTRVSQVDIRTKFYYRIAGNRIRYVDVLLDDHWQISGQFLCDEHQIDRVETINESVDLQDGGVSRRKIARVIFKLPVFGAFTLRAGFVLRDFSGIGHIRLPDIKPYHTKINKQLLAIVSDPLLSIDAPQQGRNKTISSDWSTTLVSTVNDSTLNPEQLIAEYDLTKTKPDWRLSIKTKSIAPKVALMQSTLLDAGDSILQCTGEFESENEVFGQYFTLPQSVSVESIDVYDSQRNPITIRWGRTQNTKKQNNETRIERMIFFRKPLSGKYRVTITGHFATNNIDHVPMIEFENVALAKHQFELYRTSSLIVHGDINGTVWQAENIQRNFFKNAKFIGLWNASSTKNSANLISPRVAISLNRPEIKGEIVTVLFPLSNSDSRTTPSATTQPTSNQTALSQENISVTINNTPPTTTPATNNLDTDWGTIFDVNLNILTGELEQIRFQLDENIVNVTAVEPSVKWSVEQHRTNGRSQLVISSADTTLKQQHFKIHATISGQNRVVALPRLMPEWSNGEQSEIKNYVILPLEIESSNNRIIGSEIAEDEIGTAQPKQISWNLSNLQKVDEALQGQLTALMPQKLPSTYLVATNNTYSASIIRRGARPFVSLYDVNFYIKDNGEVFGTATLDLKNIGNDKFVIAMPDNFELIKISLHGGAVGEGSIDGGGVKLDRNRWQIGIFDSDYPIRVGLIFRAVFDTIPMNLQLPILENVEVNETLWTISYDENMEIAKRDFNVNVVGADLNSAAKSGSILTTNGNTNESNNGNDAENIVTEFLGHQIPASGKTAAEMLFKFDMVRLDNLLFIASGLSAPAAGKNVEVRHWFTQWEQEWTGINRTINHLKTTYPTIINDTNNKILLSASDKNSGQRSINSLIGLMDSPEKSLQALQIRKDRESQRLGIIVTENNSLPSLIESNPVVLCRLAMTTSSSSLFGAVKGGISEIRLTANPESIRIADNFDIFMRVLVITLVLAIAVLILWQHGKINLKDIFLKHSLFWFLGLGCSTIIFFPDGIICTAIIVTILLRSHNGLLR
ncbi:MAG: hypothetical protein LBK06_10815 [Planctomycetaceae bacterium]|jgi:hypothetical protein|nr:hypothetical protein [Planctomycetaceae bacterium]